MNLPDTSESACTVNGEIQSRRKAVIGFSTVMVSYAIVSVVGIAAAFHFGSPTDVWLAAQTIAIVVAGAIYLWYTHETVRLRELAAIQNTLSREQLEVSLQQAEAAIRPLILAIPPDRANALVLKNFGNGTAVNIRVSPSSTGEDAGITFIYRFPVGIVAISPGDVNTIEAQQWWNESHIRESIVDLRVDQIDVPVELEITYSSTHFHTYKTTMILAPSGYEIAHLSDTPPPAIQRV